MKGLLDSLSLRVRDKYGWTEKEALEVSAELYYALVAKSMDNERTSVPPVLDALWHELILETRLYAQFCEQVLSGQFLHHSTTTVSDSVETKNRRVDRLLMLYKTLFDRRPYEWVWTREEEEEEDGELSRKRKGVPYKPLTCAGVQIFVKDLDGRTRTMCVELSDTVEFCKRLFAKMTNRACIGNIRFLFAGRQFEDERTLADYGVQRDSTIHHVSRMRGC